MLKVQPEVLAVAVAAALVVAVYFVDHWSPLMTQALLCLGLGVAVALFAMGAMLLAEEKR